MRSGPGGGTAEGCKSRVNAVLETAITIERSANKKRRDIKIIESAHIIADSID